MEKNSEIILCNLKGIDKDGKNVLDYVSSRLLTVCRNNATATRTRYSIIDPEKSISVNIPYGVCLTSNYVAFYNPSYSNKWWFAFIDDVIYKSDNCCEIIFTIDAWHTWFDEFESLPVMVEREHANSDTIGENIEAEPISPNEYIIDYEYIINLNFEVGFWILLTLSISEENNRRSAMPLSFYDGAITPGTLYAFKIDKSTDENFINSFNAFNSYLFDLSASGYSPDCILSINVAPLYALNENYINEDHSVKFKADITTSTDSILKSNLYEYQPINEFRPKNKKMYTFPYTVFYLGNYSGEHIELKPELFNKADSHYSFKSESILNNKFSGRLFPLNYEGLSNNRENSISLGNFPQLSFLGNYALSQMGVKALDYIATNVGASAQFSKDKKSGEEISAVRNLHPITLGVDLAMDVVGQKYSYKRTPSVIKGTETDGALNLKYNTTNQFIFKKRPPTNEARKIDEFFTRYGYATNRLKVPNITGRINFNYVQVSPDSVTCNSAIPSKYKDKINQMFRSGVTIWHHYSIIGNYFTDNSIVSSLLEN